MNPTPPNIDLGFERRLVGEQCVDALNEFGIGCHRHSLT